MQKFKNIIASKVDLKGGEPSWTILNKRFFVGQKELYHEQNSQPIDLYWTQPIQGSHSLQKLKHANPQGQDITSPDPTEEQWKAYQSDTAANTEKRKEKWNKN